jgi:Retinal pigment epithelial membrane protein
MDVCATSASFCVDATRRSLMSSALSVATGATAISMAESAPLPAQTLPSPALLSQTNPRDPAVPPLTATPPQLLFRLECDVTDCEVEGKLPADLRGAFYRVGPHAQYPMNPHNIPFDGEGHVSLFRIENGRASFKSRYALQGEPLGMLCYPLASAHELQGLGLAPQLGHGGCHAHRRRLLQQESCEALFGSVQVQLVPRTALEPDIGCREGWLAAFSPGRLV